MLGWVTVPDSVCVKRPVSGSGWGSGTESDSTGGGERDTFELELGAAGAVLGCVTNSYSGCAERPVSGSGWVSETVLEEPCF